MGTISSIELRDIKGVYNNDGLWDCLLICGEDIGVLLKEGEKKWPEFNPNICNSLGLGQELKSLLQNLGKFITFERSSERSFSFPFIFIKKGRSGYSLGNSLFYWIVFKREYLKISIHKYFYGLFFDKNSIPNFPIISWSFTPVGFNWF